MDAECKECERLKELVKRAAETTGKAVEIQKRMGHRIAPAIAQIIRSNSQIELQAISDYNDHVKSSHGVKVRAAY